MSEDPVPGWYADPTGRFEHRYWDGTAWTEHVARQGRATTDPLDGGTTPVQTTDTQVLDDGRTADHTGATRASGTWQPAGPAPRTNVKAVVAFVLSLVWFFGLASVVAIVLGVIARREVRERPDESGAGLATAAVVIGVLGVLGVLAVAAMFAAFVSFGAGEQVVVTPFRS